MNMCSFCKSYCLSHIMNITAKNWDIYLPEQSIKTAGFMSIQSHTVVCVVFLCLGSLAALSPLFSLLLVIQKTAALEVDRTKSFIWVSSAQLWSIARISRSGFLYFVSNMWTKERKRWIERTQIFIYHLIISTHDAQVLPSLFKKFLWQTSWWVSSSYRMF